MPIFTLHATFRSSFCHFCTYPTFWTTVLPPFFVIPLSTFFFRFFSLSQDDQKFLSLTNWNCPNKLCYFRFTINPLAHWILALKLLGFKINIVIKMARSNPKFEQKGDGGVCTRLYWKQLIFTLSENPTKRQNGNTESILKIVLDYFKE
jgi:hypothetical protein